jgi:23S rRNA (adenine2503-C2)-methyltransferase
MEYSFPVTLSVSLHAPTDEIRDKIMKINHAYNTEKLLKACFDYINKTGRRISFEYALIDGVNDTDECARILAKRLSGMLCHLNLIPANPVKENDYIRPSDKKVEHFSKLMNSLGINTTVRRTLGADIDASCGQLRQRHLEERKGGEG